jgi:hypothetical protein
MKLEGAGFATVEGGPIPTLGIGFSRKDAIELLLKVNEADPQLIRNIAGDSADELIKKINASDTLFWRDSRPWQNILSRILQADISKQIQIRLVKEGKFRAAKSLHKELGFSTERSLCMLFDYLWNRGSFRRDIGTEYNRLNAEAGEIEQFGPDVAEQIKIRNFFNAVARTVRFPTMERVAEFVRKRELLFVFGKGSIGSLSINLAAEYSIGLSTVPP